MSILISLGSYDGQVSGWDVGEGKFVFGYTTHLGCVKDMHARGKTLVSASSDDTCRVFDLNLKKDVGTLLGHEGAVAKVRVLRRHIVTGGDDGRICFWRAQDLEQLHKVQTKSVVALATDQEEKILLSAHSDNKLRMWDMRNAQPVWHLGLDLPIVDLAFESKHLAILPRDGRNIQIVNAPTSAVQSITTDSFAKRVTSLCFLVQKDQTRLMLGDAEGRVRSVPIADENKPVGDNEESVEMEDISDGDEQEQDPSSLSDDEEEEEELEEEDEELSLEGEDEDMKKSQKSDPSCKESSSSTSRTREIEVRQAPVVESERSRVRFLCPLGDLVVAAFADGTVEVYNALAGRKISEFQVPFRCTAAAVSFLGSSDDMTSALAKTGVVATGDAESDDEVDHSEDEEKTSEAVSEDDDIDVKGGSKKEKTGDERRVCFDLSDEEDEQRISTVKEPKKGNSRSSSASSVDTSASSTTTSELPKTTKKKRGRRAGQAARERELAEIERLAIQNVKNENRLFNKLGSGSSSLQNKKKSDKEYTRMLARMNSCKLERERAAKKEVQKSDKKKLATHRAKEAEKAKQKRDAKEGRRKEREKKKEQEKENENRKKVEEKHASKKGGKQGAGGGGKPKRKAGARKK
ncbi:unnamed protein product [Amoebophrya sp. A25]|nr:unnamed protein product [Amoebophrya sp. A25]|eukprot:GSA25T00009798001.1